MRTWLSTAPLASRYRERAAAPWITATCRGSTYETPKPVLTNRATSVREYWRLCDVALVLLRDTPTFRLVLPSKMFEAMSTARPIILGVKGESEAVLKEAGAGIAIPPEDAQALAAAIVQLADNREQGLALGKAGREFVTRRFSRDVLANRMLGVLEAVAREK